MTRSLQSCSCTVVFRGLSIKALLVLMLTLFFKFGYAQYITGPVASGAGGAGRAAIEDGEQFFHNPAAVAHSVRTASSLIYIKGYNAADEYDRLYGVTLTDNDSENYFAGAFGYVNRKRVFLNAVTSDEDYFNFSVSRFVLQQLALGISITHLRARLEGVDPLFILSGSYEQWDINFGLHYNPLPDLGLALVFYNLLPSEEKIPQYLLNQDSGAVGVYYVFTPYLRGRADVSYQFSQNPEEKFRVQMGIETKPNPLLVTRLGFEKDQLLDRRYATLGLGFDGPRLKADYFFKKNLDDSQGALHGVDFRLPFW